MPWRWASNIVNEAQEGLVGPMLNKPNVSEGCKWKKLSILNKQQSSISEAPKQSFSTRKRKEKVEDEETTYQLSKRKVATINPNDDSEKSQDFSSAMVGSQPH